MKNWNIVCLLGLLTTVPATGQSLIPNGQQQFADSNGQPVAGGSVYFYASGTTTPKTTYQNQGLTVPNTNPVILNVAGRATVWGSGSYREIVYDQFGNLIWDQITSAYPCSGTGTTAGTCAAGNDSRFTLSTYQHLISGSAATYTTPMGARQLIVDLCGAGGGSGGTSASGNATVGGAGGDTIFNGYHAAGGLGGSRGDTGIGNVSGGLGGSGGADGTGATVLLDMGGNGGMGSSQNPTNGAAATAGGGSAFWGGAGTGQSSIASAGAANTGGGAGGGANGAATGSGAGAGGGAECKKLNILTPSATYLYTIPAGGTAGLSGAHNGGSGGTDGAAGGSGGILVEARY